VCICSQQLLLGMLLRAVEGAQIEHLGSLSFQLFQVERLLVLRSVRGDHLRTLRSREHKSK